MSRYPLNSSGVRYVYVQGLGFPRDGEAYPHFDEQGVPSCTSEKCPQWSERALPGGQRGGDCKLTDCWLSDGDRQICYPVVANAMAPLQLRLRRAHETGRHDGFQEVCDACDTAGIDLDDAFKVMNGE